jgi:hypothetical protein
MLKGREKESERERKKEKERERKKERKKERERKRERKCSHCVLIIFHQFTNMLWYVSSHNQKKLKDILKYLFLYSRSPLKRPESLYATVLTNSVVTNLVIRNSFVTNLVITNFFYNEFGYNKLYI